MLEQAIITAAMVYAIESVQTECGAACSKPLALPRLECVDVKQYTQNKRAIGMYKGGARVVYVDASLCRNGHAYEVIAHETAHYAQYHYNLTDREANENQATNIGYNFTTTGKD